MILLNLHKLTAAFVSELLTTYMLFTDSRLARSSVCLESLRGIVYQTLLKSAVYKPPANILCIVLKNCRDFNSCILGSPQHPSDIVEIWIVLVLHIVFPQVTSLTFARIHYYSYSLPFAKSSFPCLHFNSKPSAEPNPSNTWRRRQYFRIFIPAVRKIIVFILYQPIVISVMFFPVLNSNYRERVGPTIYTIQQTETYNVHSLPTTSNEQSLIPFTVFLCFQ
jgi:hypothetical protein